MHSDAKAAVMAAASSNPVHPAGHQPPATAQEIVQSFEEADRHEVSLAGYQPEDWICLGIFWVMALLVFLQFFSRYVLNDSYAWTEELAVYCLIGVVFIGSSMCVRACRHIQVDFLYRYLPRPVGRALAPSSTCCARRSSAMPCGSPTATSYWWATSP